VLTDVGPVEVTALRARNGSFDPTGAGRKPWTMRGNQR
jgi:hypothetical protein